jgi:hypothetical protein
MRGEGFEIFHAGAGVEEDDALIRADPAGSEQRMEVEVMDAALERGITRSPTAVREHSQNACLAWRVSDHAARQRLQSRDRFLE